MDVYELLKALDGEVVVGRARVRHGGELITVGRVTPEGMIMTIDGKNVVDSLTAKKATKKRAVKRAEVPAKEDVQVGLGNGDD